MIDLHMHSRCSDGTDDLDELLENIKNAGVKTFALTDHDTAEGCRRLLSDEKLKQKLVEIGLEFITGAEWSCIFGKQKMHILSFGFDPFDEKILALENEFKALLKAKNDYKKAEIEKRGYVFSQKSKDYLASKENVRTLDLANCLINDGYFDDLQIAIRSLVDDIKLPFNAKLDAEKTIETLKEAGAVVVWAHPIYDIRRKVTSFEDVERIMTALKPAGLDGLECFYSLYQKEEIERLAKLCKKHNFVCSGGSDYHGANKSVPLLKICANGDVEISREDLTVLERLEGRK